MKKAFPGSFSLLLSLLTFAQGGRLSQQIGDVQKTTSIPHGVSFQITNAWAEIIAYSPTTIRVRVAKTKPTEDFSLAPDSLASRFNFTATLQNLTVCNWCCTVLNRSVQRP